MNSAVGLLVLLLTAASAAAAATVDVKNSTNVVAMLLLKHCEQGAGTLEDAFWRLSEPGNDDPFLTSAQVAQLLQPCAVTKAAVGQV
jgi:hypothetical protein